ncbi:MAG TPA: homoserine kinase [Bacteroidia bacterium]|nr:homoserine kinase [Bacteroidia bacterium]
MKTIKVFAPASVANVGCGFDVLGFALMNPGDEIILKKKKTKGIRIINKTKYKSISINPEKNCAGKPLIAFLKKVGYNEGLEITMVKKIKPGSGIGSSAASAAASVYAANELFERPFLNKTLVEYGMIGESVASGSFHADNVAPSLLGGFILLRSYSPLDIVSLPYPKGLYCALVHPDIEIKTIEARKILKKKVDFKKAITQWGNVAGLVAGLASENYSLIGRSMEDVIVEPVRSRFIPHYYKVKNKAMEQGALGCNIAGSGPSVFALCQNSDIAERVSRAMQNEFTKNNISCDRYVSKINPNGTITLS